MTRERRLGWALVLGGALFFAEILTALFSGSLALLADAGHLFLDVFALLLAYGGAKLSRRRPDQHYTYGYHRAEVLAAAINALLLFFLVGFVAKEAMSRLLAPHPVLVGPMLGMAIAGFLGNFGMALLLSRHEKEDLNMRAAFLHVLGDALGSVAVLIAALTLAFSGPLWIDPAASLFISGVIFVGAIRMAKKAMRILGEGVPDGLSLAEIAETMANVPGVREVHDLHVWTIKPGFLALTAHVVLGDRTLWEADRVAEELRRKIRERFGIEHMTIQVEGQSCPGPCCNGKVSE